MIKHYLIPDNGAVLITDIPSTPEALLLFYDEYISRGISEMNNTKVDIVVENDLPCGYIPSNRREWWKEDSYWGSRILKEIPFREIYNPIQLGGE
jgi:hypothetical protein